jgi:glycosyltransferase involved in cell wall biosynthesis
MSSLVTVIIPAFNRSNLIIDTLDSVRIQTYDSLEIIVVDDGSTDTTNLVVTNWFSVHPYLKSLLITLEHNYGKSYAVNKGMDKMRGDYVMVLDSDDVLFPQAIADEVEFLQRYQTTGAVFGNAYELRDSVKTKIRHGVQFIHFNEFPNLNEIYGDLLLNGNAIIASTVLMRTTEVRRVGYFSVTQRYVHDWDYWIRMTRYSSIGYVNKDIVYYRINSIGSSSANIFGTFLESIDLICATGKQYSIYDRLKAALWQMKYHAWLAYHNRKFMEMLKIFLIGMLIISKIFFGNHEQ